MSRDANFRDVSSVSASDNCEERRRNERIILRGAHAEEVRSRRSTISRTCVSFEEKISPNTDIHPPPSCTGYPRRFFNLPVALRGYAIYKLRPIHARPFAHGNRRRRRVGGNLWRGSRYARPSDRAAPHSGSSTIYQ